MSFPAYQEYKKSGVAWIESIPKHWTSIRLKNILKQKITDGPHSTPIFTSEGVPFLSVDGIQNGELIFESCRYISPADHAEFKRKALPQKNDLLMGKAASTGKIARVKVDFEFSIWSPLALIRIDKNFSVPEFVEYALKSPMTQAEIDTFCTANTQKNISMDDIPRLSIFHPPLKEQKAIALFLDHQTTKIETLISEQEKLIELLKEKRQAVISHAVTKGINPNVKMKNSGVVWLGDVPEHWEVMTLRRCSSNVQTGGTPSSDSINNEGEVGLDWYTPGDFTDTLTLGRSTKKISTSLIESSGIKIFPSNSVLIISIGGTLGKVGYLNQAASSNQQINAVIPNQKINGYFLAYSLAVKTEQMKYLSNASTIGIMNQEKTKEIWVAVPPLEEQFNITNYLDGITKSLDTLINTCLATITLLNERRSALISAAVTGQIDVRNYQPKEVA